MNETLYHINVNSIINIDNIICNLININKFTTLKKSLPNGAFRSTFAKNFSTVRQMPF